MEPSIQFFCGVLLGTLCGITLTICVLLLAEVMTDEQVAAIKRAWKWLTNNPQAGSDDRGMAEWQEGKR